MSNILVQSIVKEAPVVAIVRRPKVDPVRCIEHLFQTGIRLVEITKDTPDAIAILKSLSSHRRLPPARSLSGIDVDDPQPHNELSWRRADERGRDREVRGLKGGRQNPSPR